MDIDEILEEMDDLLDSAHSVPLASHKSIIDGERMRELINDIRLNIPQEIKHAKLIDYDCKRIMNEAEAEAESIVRRAEERAKAIVSQEEIVKEAKKQAAEILLKSKQKSNEVKKAVNAYVETRLNDAQTYFSNNLEDIKRTKQQLNMLNK